jgi:hypothetical protein
MVRDQTPQGYRIEPPRTIYADGDLLVAREHGKKKNASFEQK